MNFLISIPIFIGDVVSFIIGSSILLTVVLVLGGFAFSKTKEKIKKRWSQWTIKN